MRAGHGAVGPVGYPPVDELAEEREEGLGGDKISKLPLRSGVWDQPPERPGGLSEWRRWNAQRGMSRARPGQEVQGGCWAEGGRAGGVEGGGQGCGHRRSPARPPPASLWCGAATGIGHDM